MSMISKQINDLRALISRQAAIDGKISIQLANGVEICSNEAVLVEYLKNLPTVQPEPQEGHWIWVAGELMCSECRTIYSDLYPDYDNSVACPHCGAKMTISTK